MPVCMMVYVQLLRLRTLPLLLPSNYIAIWPHITLRRLHFLPLS